VLGERERKRERERERKEERIRNVNVKEANAELCSTLERGKNTEW
jgi:hypothetical protein